MDALDGPRFGPAKGGAPDALVVLVHGFGADGNDLIDLAALWAEALPGAVFVAPHAPEPCDGIPFGRQWFPLWDRSATQLAAGVAGAAAALGRFVATKAPRRSPNRSSTSFCRPTSRLSTKVSPGMASRLFRRRTAKPPAVVSSCSQPVWPCSCFS